MESSSPTLSRPSKTRNPSGFFPPRKRPQGALKGIGFILAIWVQQIHRKGVLPTSRSVAALLAIADAVDADGRWCFFFLETLAQRCGGTLSVSSLKRAIDDLAGAGVVRKLTRTESIEFFAGDIKRGRSSYQLPCVLELLVPAQDYPDLVLEEINACRAELGEEPLNVSNRPPLKPRPTPAQHEPTPSSDRPTDCSSGDCSDDEVDSSVRGTSTTEEQNRQKPKVDLFEIIYRIPDIHLADPVADRERLALAVEKLLRQGLSGADARVLISGTERLRNPFPALMRRLRTMQTAREYLDGSLGRGIHGSGLPTPPWPQPDEDDPFARLEQFLVDSHGKARGTCPEHPTVRNVPGGTCALCGRLCRSAPGELMHEPELGEAAPSPCVLVLKTPELSLPEDVALEPELLERIGASMNGAGRDRVEEPFLRGGPRLPAGSGASPRAQTLANWAREQIARAPKPTDLGPPQVSQVGTALPVRSSHTDKVW